MFVVCIDLGWFVVGMCMGGVLVCWNDCIGVCGGVVDGLGYVWCLGCECCGFLFFFWFVVFLVWIVWIFCVVIIRCVGLD